MQAKAIVMNPCFYKGFFSTTDNLCMGNIFILPLMKDQGFEYKKNHFSELINFRHGANELTVHLFLHK